MFVEELEKNLNKTARTENGALTNHSSLDANLDFFALAGAMRNNSDNAVKLFIKAYSVNPLVAIRTLFYLRDVRGGQGERLIFQKCLNYLATENESLYDKIIENDWVGEYGSYKDLFNIPLTTSVVRFIKNKLNEDLENMKAHKSVSLLAKWLPSENASSRKTRKEALSLIKLLGTTPRKYRKTLSSLRKYIDILEIKMSNKSWAEIEYSKLPSKAHLKHVKAFYRNDEARYEEYLESVKKGQTKINTNTLYTYEIYDKVKNNYSNAIDIMWNNLPDYTNNSNALVVADVSGSMYGQPMSVSVSLALYFAERNKGIFHNKFMTFSRMPQLVDVVGNNLEQKIDNMERTTWDMNTNLEAVFDVILKTAVQNKISQEELPSTIYIISDMEFDMCVRTDETIFNNAKKQFNKNGYELPHIVFWNVNSRNTNLPATKYDNNVILISGLSQSTFKYAVEHKNPTELMLDIVNSKRYDKIVIE